MTDGIVRCTPMQHPRRTRCIVNSCERQRARFACSEPLKDLSLTTLGRPPTPPNPRSPRDFGTPLSGRTHLPARGFSLARWALLVPAPVIGKGEAANLRGPQEKPRQGGAEFLGTKSMASRTRLPSPVSGKTHAMPTQDSLEPNESSQQRPRRSKVRSQPLALRLAPPIPDRRFRRV